MKEKTLSDCDLCCLKGMVYCLECFRSGMTASKKDNFRPKTDKNMQLVNEMKQKAGSLAE